MTAGSAPVREIQTIGRPIPDLELPELSGSRRTISSFLDGKRGGVVVVWSSVCSHCIRYDETFSSFASRHPELGFVVIAARTGETAEEIRNVVRERSLRFSILHSGDGAAGAALFAQQTPRAYLVDPERTLLYRGAVDNFKYPADSDYEPYLEPAISDFLAGREVSRPETASFGCAVRSVYYTLPKLVR